MLVINPDPYLLPSYRISPFRTSDISFNRKLPDDGYINEYFDERFNGRPFHYTVNGREAIRIALNSFSLEKDDVVTIFTTSANFYISRCVTDEIEKLCKWSRKIEEKSRLILINHEFGYPFEEVDSLKKYNLPVIEDCAHSFFSTKPGSEIGAAGDFAIYSFSKMFPLQIGGLLVNNKKAKIFTGESDPEVVRYIKKILSFHIRMKDEIVTKRLHNYKTLSELFRTIGLEERFLRKPGSVPGIFMFRDIQNIINLDELKKYFYQNGIQCSVFYGENSFFIPVHQALEEEDLLYFFEVMKSYINRIA